ncbi:MAG: hypothetical protein QXR54_00500 [Nanopusillaceae archaeon]
MKKSISLFIEFLIYVSFSLLALSYVLYYSYYVTEREKTKLEIENIISLLNEYHAILSIYRNCGICSFTFKKQLPLGSKIIFLNDSNIIYATYTSRTQYNTESAHINISIEKRGSLFYYNISKNTYNYIILNNQELNFTRELCIKTNIIFNQIFIENC